LSPGHNVKFDALAAGDSGMEKNKNKTKTRVKFDALAAGRFRHHVVTAEGKNKTKNKTIKTTTKNVPG